MKEYFETTEALEAAIDDPPSVEFADLLDRMFFDRCEIDPNELSELPYWAVDSVPYCWNGRILETEDHGCLTVDEFENQDLWVEYRPGIYETHRYGDTLTINGADYVYIGSVPLSAEIEHQADDGGLVYEYRGETYLRILLPVETLINNRREVAA